MDQGQFIELAYQTGLDVSEIHVQLYNGNTGRTYGGALVVSADGIPGSVGPIGGLSFVYFDIIHIRHAVSGNGIALVDGRSGAVLEFISYDGQFNATNGPARGLESVPIGVSELIDGDVGLSLQLGGSGCVRSDFSWQAVQAETKGTLNRGQTSTCV